MSVRATWSPPYHGVQHMAGVARGYYVTVTAHESYCAAYILRGIVTLAEGDFTTPADAIAWSERRAAELGVLS